MALYIGSALPSGTAPLHCWVRTCISNVRIARHLAGQHRILAPRRVSRLFLKGAWSYGSESAPTHLAERMQHRPGPKDFALPGAGWLWLGKPAYHLQVYGAPERHRQPTFALDCRISTLQSCAGSPVGLQQVSVRLRRVTAE